FLFSYAKRSRTPLGRHGSGPKYPDECRARFDRGSAPRHHPRSRGNRDSTGTNAGPFTGSSCKPAYPFTAANLAPGMHAWTTTLHALPTAPVTYGTTERDDLVGYTAFVGGLGLPSLKGPLNLDGLGMPSPGELAKLTGLCQFIVGNGSGAGICKSCKLGGLGGAKQ